MKRVLITAGPVYGRLDAVVLWLTSSTHQFTIAATTPQRR